MLGLAALVGSGSALGRMSYQYAAADVSRALILAALCLGLAALAIYFQGRSAFADRLGSPVRASLLLHAAGSVTILIWMTLTQMIAGLNYNSWNYVSNVWPTQTGFNLAALAIVLVAAVLTVQAQKRAWLAWVRFAWYGLVPFIGLLYVVSQSRYLSGFVATDYWVTTCLNAYGGVALLLFSAIVIVTRIAAWRRIGDPRLAK